MFNRKKKVLLEDVTKIIYDISDENHARNVILIDESFKEYAHALPEKPKMKYEMTENDFQYIRNVIRNELIHEILNKVYKLN